MTVDLKRLLNHRTAVVAAVAAAALFVALSLAGERGFLRLAELARQRDGLRETVRSLQADNDALAREVRALREDPATVETLARTRLDMVRPGEVVYVFPPEASGRQR